MYKVCLPEKILYENLTSKLNLMKSDYEKSFKNTEVLFDFGQCKLLGPTGLVYISMWKDHLNEQGIKTYMRKPVAHVFKFLQSFGILGECNEETIYEKYMVKMNRCYSINECRNVHTEIIRRVKDENFHKETYASIDYMLNELWDNSGVHGYECYSTEDYPKPVYFGAYFYRDRIEIAIADRGQGIYQSLKKNNKEYRNKTVKDTILDAIKDGVSGHPNGSPGFGLYCSSEFLKQGKGQLNIWSSGYQLSISSSSTRIIESAFSVGTLISFVIYKTARIPFQEILAKPQTGKRDVDEYIETFIGDVFI